MLRRTMPLAVAVAALVAPAGAAAATTWTVDPSAAAGCSAANVCKTISDANARVADGDTVQIKDGAYVESGPIVVTKKNVTFKATPGKAAITQTDGKTNTPIFSIGDGTVLDGLVLNVQPNGGQAVLATAGGGTVKNSSLLRVQANTSNAPVVGSTAPSGTISLQFDIVFQAPRTTDPNTKPPAIAGNATSTLAIADSLIVGGGGTGAAVTYAGNDKNGSAAIPNTITRSQLLATDAAANAVTLDSPVTQAVAQELDIDSSVLSSGANGTGIAASNAADITGTAGSVTVKGVHVTVAGGARPVTVDSEVNPLGNPVTGAGIPGAVAVTLDRSIVHGSSASTVKTTTNLAGSSTATIAIKNSDATDAAATGITLTANVKNADDTLFADAAKRNFHLRIGAPDIDKGGAQGAGESTLDIDQQPRVVGSASDLGADEFVNLPPRAAIAASAATVKQGETVTFDGSKSVDPDAGGGIAKYQWDFGDGQTAETTTPTTTHAYSAIGTFTPSLKVVDPQGNTSAASAAPAIAVTDGVPPKVAITSPANNRVFKIFKTKRTRLKSGKLKTTKTRNRFAFKGTATDDAGIASVELSIRRVSLGSASAAATSCVYLDGKSTFISKSCKKPKFFPVAVTGTSWAYRTKSTARFRAGTYEISARATDKSGVVSAPVKITLTLR